MLRKQLFLEGVKNGQAGRLLALENIIAREISQLMAVQGVTRMGEMTKRDYRRFISMLNKRMRPHLRKLNTSTTAEFRKFLAADLKITRDVFNAVAGTGPKTATAARLWARYKAAIMPGTGLTPPQMLTGALNSTMAQTHKLLGAAYAENKTMLATLQDFTGTRANAFRDGLRRKMNNQFNAMLNTVLQSISSYVNAEVGANYFERYKWVSVLDSKTTDICRGRDGNIYIYGEGPVPPAHYNCRSVIVPYNGDAGGIEPKPEVTPTGEPIEPIPTQDDSFYRWIQRQPNDVQNDILGVTWGRALRTGKLSPDQIAGFDTVRKLTIDGYRLKAPIIVK